MICKIPKLNIQRKVKTPSKVTKIKYKNFYFVKSIDILD